MKTRANIRDIREYATDTIIYMRKAFYEHKSAYLCKVHLREIETLCNIGIISIDCRNRAVHMYDIMYCLEAENVWKN